MAYKLMGLTLCPQNSFSTKLNFLAWRISQETVDVLALSEVISAKKIILYTMTIFYSMTGSQK